MEKTTKTTVDETTSSENLELLDGATLAQKSDSQLLSNCEPYFLGETTELPAFTQKLLNNAVQKIVISEAVASLGNYSRELKLQRYCESCEDVLFDEAELLELNPIEVAKRYKDAGKTLLDLRESKRKFITQNKEFEVQSNRDKLTELLRTVSDEDYKDLQLFFEARQKERGQLAASTVTIEEAPVTNLNEVF